MVHYYSRALFANIKEIFIFTNENENFDDEWETRIVLIVEELRIGKKWLRADTGPAASTGRICGGNWFFQNSQSSILMIRERYIDAKYRHSVWNWFSSVWQRWYKYLCWWDDQKKSKDMGGGEPCWWITFRICGISMGEVFPGSRWAPAAPHRLARWTSITRWAIAGRQHHIYAPVFNGNWILSILWRLNDIVNA